MRPAMIWRRQSYLFAGCITAHYSRAWRLFCCRELGSRVGARLLSRKTGPSWPRPMRSWRSHGLSPPPNRNNSKRHWLA